MDFDTVITSVRGETIRLQDVLTHLKLKGLVRTGIYELIERRVIEQAIRFEGLQVPPEDIEKHARNMRAQFGVSEEGDFSRYLRFYGVTAEQWHDFIRHETYREFLKHHMVTTQKINEFFRLEPLRFASVSVARIACRTAEEAGNVLAAAKANPDDFVRLARSFSCDESTRHSGGFIGNVKRGMLLPEVETQVFSSGENRIVGPFHENTLWTVYHVHAMNVPKLTDALRKVIRDQIFNDWLRKQVSTVPA